jgi:hypothetical protein
MLVLITEQQNGIGNTASSLCLVSVKSIVSLDITELENRQTEVVNGAPKNEFCYFATLKSVQQTQQDSHCFLITKEMKTQKLILAVLKQVTSPAVFCFPRFLQENS